METALQDAALRSAFDYLVNSNSFTDDVQTAKGCAKMCRRNCEFEHDG
jgi:hypothetical protein